MAIVLHDIVPVGHEHGCGHGGDDEDKHTGRRLASALFNQTQLVPLEVRTYFTRDKEVRG